MPLNKRSYEPPTFNVVMLVTLFAFSLLWKPLLVFALWLITIVLELEMHPYWEYLTNVLAGQIILPLILGFIGVMDYWWLLLLFIGIILIGWRPYEPSEPSHIIVGNPTHD